MGSKGGTCWSLVSRLLAGAGCRPRCWRRRGGSSHRGHVGISAQDGPLATGIPPNHQGPRVLADVASFCSVAPASRARLAFHPQQSQPVQVCFLGLWQKRKHFARVWGVDRLPELVPAHSSSARVRCRAHVGVGGGADFAPTLLFQAESA